MTIIFLEIVKNVKRISSPQRLTALLRTNFYRKRLNSNQLNIIDLKKKNFDIIYFFIHALEYLLALIFYISNIKAKDLLRLTWPLTDISHHLSQFKPFH